ncbi:MAG: epimerase [Anaerolinea sp.]|nr:epimerase [Anaerolinea sp.]
MNQLTEKVNRVLVTGASGFIGQHSLHLLISNGFDVHAVGMVIPKENKFPVQWHKVDLLDTKEISEFIESLRPSHLLHFAWLAKPEEFWTSLESMRWVEASLHLMYAFQKCGGQRIVMAGSCAEYDWRYGYCSEKITPLMPSTVYGKCKNALQNLLYIFSEETGLSSAWGRIFFVYGPHENQKRLVASVINNLLKDQTAKCSFGTQLRDYMHVEDVASAFVDLLKSNVTGPVNIASGQLITVKDIILTIADKMQKNNLIHLGAIPMRQDEPHVLLADTKKLNCEVNWQPKYSIESGIMQTIEWWQRQVKLL